AVIHNWLDDVIVSPWVSLASTPSATSSLLSFRIFPGNRFAQSKIIQSWRVRSKTRIDNTDTSAPGDSIDCVTPWEAVNRGFFKLESFVWQTQVLDMAFSVSPVAREIQVSSRVSDWQLLSGGGPPATVNTGPGPYIDRVRIGRRV